MIAVPPPSGIVPNLHNHSQVLENEGAALINLTSDYFRAFREAIKGAPLTTPDLCGGNKIKIILADFQRKMEQISPFGSKTDQEIETSIKNVCGVRGSLIISEKAFKLLTKGEISAFKKPSYDCLFSVFQELKKLARRIQAGSDETRDHLLRRVEGEVQRAIAKQYNEAREMLDALFLVESGYINVKHPDFVQSRFEILSQSSATQNLVRKHQVKENSVISSHQSNNSASFWNTSSGLNQSVRRSDRSRNGNFLEEGGSRRSRRARRRNSSRSSAGTATQTPNSEIAAESQNSSIRKSVDKILRPIAELSKHSFRRTRELSQEIGRKFMSWFGDTGDQSGQENQQRNKNHPQPPRLPRLGASSKAPPKAPAPKISFKERKNQGGNRYISSPSQLHITKRLVGAYFSIVRNNLIDYVPKTVVSLMVNECCESIEPGVIGSIFKSIEQETEREFYQSEQRLQSDYSFYGCGGSFEGGIDGDGGVGSEMEAEEETEEEYRSAEVSLLVGSRAGSGGSGMGVEPVEECTVQILEDSKAFLEEFLASKASV